MRLTSRLFVIALLSLPAATASAAEMAFPRWAVIASKTVAECGLPDLLTVRLSQDDSIELVERERLQEATRELQLASLMKADNVDGRLRLGETLGADALIVLSIEQPSDRRVLRVVVCAAKLGVRLLHEELPFDDAKVEELIEPCAATVAEVRQRFADGIRHIVAVPPFLSEDFGQRFDYLQSRQSELLSSALTAQVGVAVVEIEEAQALLREQEGILTGGLDRPIATIVRGKYHVGPLNEDNLRQIEVEVELVRNDRDRELIRRSCQLGIVGHWLVNTLSKRVLGGSENETPALSPESQKAVLARHAQRFAELGDWERSISLREAALVLDVNDALQRALVISEYQQMIKRLLESNWDAAIKRPTGPRVAALQRAADDYAVALDHLQYLIRHKLITRADALGLFRTQRWYLRGRVSEARHSSPLKHAALEPACVAQREFLREVGAEIDQLPPGRSIPERFSTPFYGLQYTLTHHILMDVVFNNYDSGALESLRDVLERIVPDDAQVSGGVLGGMRRSFAPEKRQDLDAYRAKMKALAEKREALQQVYRGIKDPQEREKMSEAIRDLQPIPQKPVGSQEMKARGEWLSYLRRLSQSDREVVKLYGQWGRLLASADGTIAVPRTSPDALSALIEDVDRQLAELKRLDRIGEPSLASIEQTLTMKKNRIRAATSPPPPPQLPSTGGNAVVRESFGRMRFNPISLVVEGGQKIGPAPLIKGMLQCGDNCDAYWTTDQFFVMHQPGVLRELKLTDRESDYGLFREVTWDGECIWMYAHGQGVIAVHPDGTRLATFNQTEHLPGYWKGISLLGLSPRRALIVASFGESKRGWCGILEIDESGKQSVNVFFEAKYVAAGRRPEDAVADPKTAFQPVWIHRLQSRNGKNNIVLVGRHNLAGTLQIDLDTLDVSVSRYGTHDGRQAFFSHDGHLLVSRGGSQLLHYFPPARDGSVRARVLANINPYVDQLLLHEGWVYVPGRTWLRFDPDQRKPERLQPWPTHLPGYYASLKGGVSAHYGLIAYYLYSRPLYQVTILAENEEDQTKGSEQ